VIVGESRSRYYCLFSRVHRELIRTRGARFESAMRRKSLYPAAGTAVHLSNPAVAGTLGRMLFNNFFHNYSLPLNKNQFPTYFHFTFSPVTLIKGGGFVAFKRITYSHFTGIVRSRKTFLTPEKVINYIFTVHTTGKRIVRK
jgi:hypothetical protein